MLAAGRRPLRLVLVVVVAAALGSCGTSEDHRDAGAITMQEFAFNPSPFLATVGQSIRVVNLDGVVHTLTADDGSVATRRLASGGTDTITVTRPGVTAYHCAIHDFMRGRIRIKQQTRSK
jgi:plastocyanin